MLDFIGLMGFEGFGLIFNGSLAIDDGVK